MKLRSVRSLAAVFLVLLCAGALALPPVFAGGEDDAKKSVKKLGSKMKELGKKIGEAGKEAGEEAADAAKKVWYKGKKVSAPLLKRTQRATRDFWEVVLRGKDDTIRELRKENEHLRRKLEKSE